MDRRCSTCKKAFAAEWKSHRCKDCTREYQRAWRNNNPDRRRDQRQRHRSLHGDTENARFRTWRSENKDLHGELKRRWSRQKPDRLREYDHRRRAREKAASIGTVDLKAVWEAAGGVCCYCRAFVPDLPGYRHTDHYQPLEAGGPHCQENLRAACYRCNTSKGAKLPEAWSPKPILAKGREDQGHLFNPDWNL